MKKIISVIICLNLVMQTLSPVYTFGAEDMGTENIETTASEETSDSEGTNAGQEPGQDGSQDAETVVNSEIPDTDAQTAADDTDHEPAPETFEEEPVTEEPADEAFEPVAAEEEAEEAEEPALEAETRTENVDEASEEDGTKDEPTGDVLTGLVPIYANAKQEDFQLSGILAGYAKLDATTHQAKFYYALADSTHPQDAEYIRVPRRIVVTSLDGVPTAIDYTEGYNLDPDGYATSTHYSTWSKTQIQEALAGSNDNYITYDVQLDELDDDGNYKVEKRRLYIGTAYDVTEMDADVFKSEKLEKHLIKFINIPSTIKTYITYEFFAGLKQAREITVYESKGYDKYYADCVTFAETYDDNNKHFRYISSGASASNVTGDDAVVTKFVLVDTKPGIEGIDARIVYCPPKYQNTKYTYHYGTGGTTQNIHTATVIDPHAFENCENLKVIEPKSVGVQVIYDIGECAFKGCTSLVTVKLFSKYLRSVGDEAFADCTSLEDMSNSNTGIIRSKKTTLGKSVFANTIIKRLEIPVGYDSMTGETFKDMDLLERIDVIPDDDTDEINTKYYSDEFGVLYRYVIPGEEKEKGIPDVMDGLELVRYPSMCETWADCPDASANLKTEKSFFVPWFTKSFDEYCFYKCNNVYNMYFPSTIRKVGLNRFFACESLTHVYFYSGLPDFELKPSEYAEVEYFGEPRKYMYIHAGTGTPIYEYACANAGDPYKMNHLDSKGHPLYDISDFTFEYLSTGATTGTAAVMSYNPPANSTVTHVVIPNYFMKNGVLYTVTGINSGALANPGIESVYMLHDMKDVADDAFYVVKNREDIDDDRNINAVSLANIYVEPGNFNLGTVDGVLYKLVYNKKTQQYEPSELLYYPVGNEATEYTTLMGISILPEFAFWGAKNLKVVNIYNSIQEIGYNKQKDKSDEHMSFEGCTSLVKVNILPMEDMQKNSIRYWSDNGVLYRWDPNEGSDGAPVTLVFYPYGRREMAEDETSPVSYRVADGCTEVLYVKKCPYLSGIIFPKSVTNIADYAFEGSGGIASVEFMTSGGGLGIQRIGKYAFAFTDIAALKLPDTIVEIGEGAFYDCNDIETISIQGDKLTKIGEEAFFRVDGKNGPSKLRSLEISCNKNNETAGALAIGDRAFMTNPNLTSVTIRNMEDVSFGDSVFRRCGSLKEVKFDNSVVIGAGVRVFEDCDSLVEIDLSDQSSLLYISDYMFYGCDSLEEVALPDKVQSIGKYAFKNCPNLIILNFEDLLELMEIQAEAFANTGFIAVNLPPNLHTLGNKAFQWTPGQSAGLLSTIYVPEHVIFKDVYGNYNHNNGQGPFYNYGSETYVYGIYGSDVENYLKYMRSMGYDVPTFVGAESMPTALVDIKESVVDTYNVGDETPMLTAVVTSMDRLMDYSVRWYVMDPAICYLTNQEYDTQNKSTCLVHGSKLGSTKVFAINKQTGAFDYCVVNVKDAGIEVNPANEKDDNLQTVNGVTLPKSIILNCKGSNRRAALNAVSDPVRKLYYKSNNKRIVAINKKGVVRGKRPGVGTVVAYAGKGETYVEAEVEVTVFKPVTKLDVKKLVMNSTGDEENLSRLLHVTHSGAYEDVTWTTSNSRVATVEGDNDSAVVRAVGPGKAYVTAICNGIKSRCRVIVKPTGVTLNANSVMLYTGQTQTETFQLKARTKGMKKDVTWASDKPEIASVNTKGLVTAIAPGTAVISAFCNGVEARCNVRVTESTIKIYGGESGDSNEEKAEILMNRTGDRSTYQLRARVVGRKDKVTWKSAATNILKVSKDGLVTAKGGGTAEVSATCNGDTAYCTVNVIDNYTELNYADVTLFLEGSDTDKMITLEATIEGADPTKAVKWESEDPEIVAVSPNSGKADMEQTTYGGKSQCSFTALKEGETRVKATANGVTAYCKIKVKK